MAKGLDDLIEFLLGEIAVSGSRGITVDGIAAAIRLFYRNVDNGGVSSAPSPVAVDRALLSKIWTWLGRHPGVSIGHDRQYNKTTLAEVELEYPGFADSAVEEAPRPVGQPSGSGGYVDAPKPLSPSAKPRSVEGPTFRVNDDRVYQAICGHPRDNSKVAPLEFDLLTHIAARRSDGILQGELVRLSGQDKRSVPKRTDALQEKGYIIKEAVYRKGNRTSRLILKKLAPTGEEDEEGEIPERRGRLQNESSVRDVVRRIFDVLSAQNLIAQTQLAAELNLEPAAESAALLKILRRLDRLKLVKRVRTAIGPSASSGDLRNFVQLLRSPDREDLENFDSESLSLDQSVQRLASLFEPESHDDSAIEAETTAIKDKDAGTVRQVARWNPDRLMPNVVCDATRLAGHAGLSNWDARLMITGPFVRRTIESLLLRISCQSLILQPVHLRHLAIIRASHNVDGVARFSHYSWQTFCDRANAHDIDVAQIPGARQALKSLQEHEGDHHATGAAKTDQFGFAIQGSPLLQFRNGQATIPTLLEAVSAADVIPRVGEPVVVQDSNGRLSLESRDAVPRPVGFKPPRQSSMPQTSRAGAVGASSGRPRKYMRGTESFWRRQFKQAKKNAGGSPSTSSKGVMQDPAGLALYAGRPAEFDEILSKAISAGLPLPELPQDISEAWIKSTKKILDRSSEGVYITPPGLRHESTKQKSQIMVIKSSRLHQVDFHDRNQLQPFRLISSSASHSHAFRRYYPALSVTSARPQHTSRIVKGKARDPHPNRGAGKNAPPPIGVFFEDPPPTGPTLSSSHTVHDTDIFPDVLMDTTDEEPGMQSHRDRDTGSASHASSTSTPLPGEPKARQAIKEKRTPPDSKSRVITDATLRSRTSRSPERMMLATEHRSRSGSLSRYKSDSGRDRDSVPQTRAEGQQGSTEHQTSQQMSSLFREQKAGNSGEIHTEDKLTPTRVRSEFVTEEEMDSANLAETNPRRNELPSTTRDVDQASRFGLTHLHDLEDTESVQDKAASEIRTTAKRDGALRKKRRRGDETSDSEYSTDGGRARKRQVEARRRVNDANSLCRTIIVQLISETSGVVPNDPSTFKRVCAPRWQEAGEEDRPLLKTIKAAIKTLCEQGKLRHVTFSFRAKNGFMLKRSVLFLPKISPLSQLVEETRQKVVEAEPADYIPPAWREEGFRIPLVSKRAQSTISEHASTPARRRRASTAATDMSTAARTTRMTRSVTKDATPTPPSSPPLKATAATGFLTLRVPRLGSLPVVQLHNWRTQTPVTALRFDTSASNPWKRTAAQPPKRGRKSRKPATGAGGHAIVWANGRAQTFPSSLQDILELPDLKIRFEDIQSDDLNWQRLACEVKGVCAWEEQQEAAFRERFQYAFINHTVPAALYVEAIRPTAIHFESLVHIDEDGADVEMPYPPTESWPLFISALATSPEHMAQIAGRNLEQLKTMPPPPIEAQVRRTGRQRKRKASGDDSTFTPQPKRRGGNGRKITAATASRRRTRPSGVGNLTKLSRGARYLQIMPEETIYRIVVSVVVVRTLAGGLESYIDWPVVMTLFPDDEEDFVRARWKTLSQRFRQDIRGLTENLQWKYLEALQAGEVASVDFQDLPATDWQGIVEWASKKLDRFNSKRIEDLPESQEEFLEQNHLDFAEPKRLYHLLGYNANVSNPAKEDLVSSLVSGSPVRSTLDPHLHYTSRFERDLLDSQLHLAKSWVFATILTAEIAFDAGFAHAKLSRLAHTPSACEALLTRAIKLLQEEKFIQRTLIERHSEHVSTLRVWEGCRRFYERFDERRMINTRMVRRAVAYKLDVLDVAFANGETVLAEKDGIVDDGEMVAVLNLMAMGHVRLKPGADVPRTRYGLDSERVGYKTKVMDKKLLGFGVVMAPSNGYVFGDPMSAQRKISIPRGRADEVDGLIPAWITIHGAVQLALWEMFVVGVIGLVAQMPGVSALEVSRALGFALDWGEVELLLQWCVQAGFAKVHAASGGYETTEWWWMCISRGDEGGWEWNV